MYSEVPVDAEGVAGGLEFVVDEEAAEAAVAVGFEDEEEVEACVLGVLEAKSRPKEPSLRKTMPKSRACWTF